MRQTISGVVAAIAVMTAGVAPALACDFTACAPYAHGYGSAPTVFATGCGSCGGNLGYDVYQRMAEPDTQYYPTTRYSPTTQYYYVNQGPTYSGPGMFAPYPTYQENALGADERAPYWHRHYRHGYHHGYARQHDGYPLRRYY